MSELRVVLLGETSPNGRQWLQQMQNDRILEIHEATDEASIFEDYERVKEVPVILIENSPTSRAQILSVRQAGSPSFIVWFGGSFSKEDFEFAMEHRVYAVLEKPGSGDNRAEEIFSRLARKVAKASGFNNLVGTLNELLVQGETEESANPIFGELRSATRKLEEIQSQNEFNFSHSQADSQVRKIQFEAPLPGNSKEEVGSAIEAMEDLERTGTLWVKGKKAGEEGHIEFIQGKIVSAETGEIQGLKAIFRMFLWNNPNCLFSRESASEVPISEYLGPIPVDYIAQGRRYKVDFDAFNAEVPPGGIHLEMNIQGDLSNLELDRTQFNVLASVVEFGRVSEIVDYNTLPDCEIYQALIALRKSDVIRVRRAG